MCITVKWTWYNGRDKFFHITSGRINAWSGVNQLKELFFLSFIIFFNINIWNWQIMGILWLKTHSCSQFIAKMGFCCEILSLNDLTPSPISRPGAHCFQWQRANARANLWWRHEPRALCGKSGGRKKVFVMLGYHSIQQMLSIQHNKSDLGKKSPLTMLTERRTSLANHLFTLHTVAHADHREAIPIDLFHNNFSPSG